MPKIRWSLLVLLFAGLLTLAACSDDDDDDGDAATGGDVDTVEEAPTGPALEVILDEWGIEAPETTDAGTIRFDVRNRGGVDHQLTVIRTDLPADELPTESGLVTEAAGEFVGVIDGIPGGGEGSGAIELAAGNYVLVCNIPGHYDLKMRTALTVN